MSIQSDKWIRRMSEETGMIVPIYVGLALLFVVQTWQLFRVNREVFARPVPEVHRYQFRQVAILDLAVSTAIRWRRGHGARSKGRWWTEQRFCRCRCQASTPMKI